MSIRITDVARWQLRLAVQDLQKKSGNRHKLLIQEVRHLLDDHAELEEKASPLPGLTQLPYRQVDLETHSLFFRTTDDTIWLVGIWPPQYAE